MNKTHGIFISRENTTINLENIEYFMIRVSRKFQLTRVK